MYGGCSGHYEYGHCYGCVCNADDYMNNWITYETEKGSDAGAINF